MNAGITHPPRRGLTREAWTQLAHANSPPLLALWADTREVYALLRNSVGPLVVSTEVIEGGYPALSPVRPDAAWFERMVRDLWGHSAVGGADQRPWLDHGRWPNDAPMSPRPGPSGRTEPPTFALDEELDQIALGPVRGGIEPAAHLRLGVRGETIVRLETRLGYTHKGTLGLMRGKSPRAAARFAARLAAEATVAHSLAFARATEAVLDCEVPFRARALRDVMAGVEGIACHLDVLSAIAEAVELGILSTRSAWHAEMLRRASNVAFGHRLMMDCIVPGGVAADIVPGGPEAIGRALNGLAEELAELRLLPNARALIGRAGNPDARARERLRQIAGGIAQVRGRLATMPDDGVSVPLAAASGEGVGSAQGPNGDIWHWLRLDHGQIAAVFMCDPGWIRWPELEAIMAGAPVDDLRLLLAALGLSSSGMDL